MGCRPGRFALLLAIVASFLSAAAAHADILYVADAGTNTVATVGPGGSTTGGTTFATGFSNATGLAFDSSGNLYVTNNVGGSGGSVAKVPPGGGSSSPFASGFANPSGLAFDSSGNLYVAVAGGNKEAW